MFTIKMQMNGIVVKETKQLRRINVKELKEDSEANIPFKSIQSL